MFGFFKFKKSSSSPAPGWLKWGIIVFLLFILLFNSRSFNGQPNNIQLAFSNVTSQIPSTRDYARHIPDIKRPQIQIEGDAQGLPALCGQMMDVNYAGFEADQQVIDGQVSVLNLPKNEHPKFWQFVKDLQPGQTKHLVFSQAEPISRWLEVERDQSVTSLQLSINRIWPDMPSIAHDDAISIKLFDEKTGEGTAATCGDEVVVHYQAFDGSGELAAQGRSDFTIGEGEVIIGLEQGVIGMQPGGQRILLLSPAWQSMRPHLSKEQESEKLKTDHDNTQDATDKPLTALPKRQMMTLQVIREK